MANFENNLEALRNLRNQLGQPDMAGRLEDYFIGALSSSVDEKTWQECLELAKTAMRSIHGSQI